MSHYQVQTNVASHFVRAGNRILGAYGTSFWRSFVYPFYTPSGRTVVENFPFDHPFHNGIFVGQNPVKVGDREGNFWAFPVKRSHDDHIMKRMGRVDPQGEVAETPLDFVESFTPPPDCDLPLGDARRAWPGKTLMVHLPSSLHLGGADTVRRTTGAQPTEHKKKPERDTHRTRA